jgi:EAL domain-containing protein (putative c-di-GMP-specific phosphodiesterase class I)
MRRQLPDHPSFQRLIVEIDSSELIGGVPQVHGLGSAGIGVSIDNLGVEHSSLVGLEKLPVMEVKVARHVISGCAQDRLKRALCGTILDIARRLGARTVAEGVETPADLIAAREIGFDLVQGFCSASRWKRENSPARCAARLPCRGDPPAATDLARRLGF